MEFKPYPYQKHCIDKILEYERVGLFLDMGLGKSVITLTAVKILKYEMLSVSKCLVIAPKKVAEGTWSSEAQKWDHTKCLRVSKVLGPLKDRVRALTVPADIYVINRENVPWLVNLYKNSWPFDMVVIDESSSFKSHSSKRFKALAAVSPHIYHLVELTGTPSPNGLLDLWSQVYLLDGGERLGRRFTQYRERYFEPDKRSYDGIIYSYRIKPGAEETILSKISDICISMKTEDYLDLPDLIEHEVPVVLDYKAAKAYKELEKQMVLGLDEEDITVTSAAALSNKLLQLSNGAVYDEEGGTHLVHDCKLEALGELMESLQGRPALVFYSFRSDRERIIEAFGKKYKVRPLDGYEDVDAWNNHECDILLAHPASCAYGLNLQHGGNNIVWFGLTWNYELYAQANKRLHRQGQTDKVFVHHLISKGTRDEDVMRALQHKDKSQEYVMESLKARIKEAKSERHNSKI